MNKSLLNTGYILRSSSIMIALISLCLFSPSSASGNTRLDNQPMAEKLDTKAGRSKELYVEPEFRFNTFKSMTRLGCNRAYFKYTGRCFRLI